MTNRTAWLLGVTLSATLLLASCTTPDEGEDTTAGPEGAGPPAGLVNVADDADVTPQAGGTLDVSLYSFPDSLDPAQSYGTIATSGIPMAAVYDVLLRYDPDSGDYEPKLAESLSHNEDFTEWELELPDDVEFSDGTPLDSAAVVVNLERIVSSGKTTIAPIVDKVIDEYETPDAHTVVFHLSKAWSRFPYILATNGGMVASPDAVDEQGDDFGQHPVGAGPFTVTDYTANEAITMQRNNHYSDGDVPLEELRFTQIAGGDATAERFDSGEVQLGVSLDPKTIDTMIADDTPGYLVYNHAGGWVPNQNDGHPTADPRIRKAVAHAMDVEQLNQRAADGKASFHRDLFPADSHWDATTAETSHDPERAKELVEEVKKDTEWDGTLRLLAVQNQQSAWREAITLQGQLDDAGFDAELDGLQDINELTRRTFVKQDYDLAYWVVTAWDAAPWIALYSNMGSGSERNPYGYASDDFDELLDELRAAPDDDVRREVIAEMQQQWDRDQPVVLDKSSENFVFWDERVHGVEPSSLGVVLLDEAFLADQ